VVLNLSKNKALEPVWIPIDLGYGITDRITIFLNHGTINGPVSAASGPCIGGKNHGCYRPYNNVNLGAQYSAIKLGGFELSGIGALQARTLDSWRLAADLGVGLKYGAGPVAVRVSPQISIGINKRDVPAGNRERIDVPLEIALQVTPSISIFANSGINGQVDGFSVTYVVPVGIGATFAATPQLDLGAQLMFPNAATGMTGDNPTDLRVVGIFAAYHSR
jgi:hypothetical protein